MGANKVEEGRVRLEAGLPRAPRPDLCRRFARKELAAGLPGILKCFIAEAQKGSIPHLKALTSLAGLEGAGAAMLPLPKRGRRPRNLSELLLRELRRPPVLDAAKAGELEAKI